MAQQARTLRMIIAYKAIKGAVLTLAGLALIVAVWRGHGGWVHELALTLRRDVTSRLAIEVAEGFAKISAPGHLAITSFAITLEGTVGMIEAWLLHRRQRWAIGVVVVATSLPIPWELYELITHFRWSRLVLLLLNVAVVVYLGWQSSKHLALYSSTSSGSGAGGGAP